MKKESGVFVAVLVAFCGVVFGLRCQVDELEKPKPILIDPAPPEIEIKPTPPVLPQPDFSKLTDAALLSELRKRSGKPTDAETRAMLAEALKRGLVVRE